MQQDMDRKDEELTFQRAELDKQGQQFQSLKDQLGESRDATLNLKRENTELLIDKRAMESDIADKLKTIATVEKEKQELQDQNQSMSNQLQL